MSGMSIEDTCVMLGRFLGVYDLFKNSCECSATWWMLLKMPAVSRVSREGMWAMLGRFLGVYGLFKNSCECTGRLGSICTSVSYVWGE